MEWISKTDVSGFQVRWCEELASRWFDEGHWRNETLVDAARRRMAENPEALFQIEGERRVTRSEVWDASLRLAGWFLSRGLKPGDVISFQLPNWTETPVIGLAARMCGLVINPIPPIYRESELEYILGNCGSKAIFVPGTFRKCDHAAMVESLRGKLPDLRDVVVVRDAGDLTWDQVIPRLPTKRHFPRSIPLRCSSPCILPGRQAGPRACCTRTCPMVTGCGRWRRTIPSSKAT